MVAATGLLGLVTLFINDTITNNFTGYEPTLTVEGFYYFSPREKLGGKPQLVDVDSNIANSTFFPKCCPPHFLYEPEDRQCGEDRNAPEVHRELNVSIDLIKRGLPDCAIVVDRFVDKSGLKRSDGDGELVIGDETFPSGRFCVDGVAGNDRLYVLRLCNEREYCLNRETENGSKNWCVHKCCPDTYALQDETCKQIDKSGLRVKENREKYQSVDGYGFLYGTSHDCNQTKRLDVSRTAFTVRTDGRLLIQGDAREYKLDDYCLDTGYNTTDKNYVDILIVCNFGRNLYAKETILKIAATLNCVCFALIVAVYVFVYKLKKLVQKVMSCLCLMGLVFWILCDLRMFYVRFGKFCTAFGYFFYFVMLLRLTWLNVLCYEIWNTVGKVRVKVGETRRVLRKKFLYYCLYTVTLPLIFMMLFILGDQEVYPLPSNIKSYIHPAKCVIDTKKIAGYGRFIYFHLPVSVLIIINVTFYTKTVLHFLRVKRALNKISDSAKSDRKKEAKSIKRKKYIILKLGLVMGVTKIYYIYHSLHSFDHSGFLHSACYIMRFFNFCEGLYFLIIFIVNRKTLKGILHELGICRKQEVISRGVSTTSTVCTSIESTESLSGMAMDPVKT